MALIKQAWNGSYRSAVFPTGEFTQYSYEQNCGHFFNMVAKNVLHELYHCFGRVSHPICNGGAGNDDCDDTASRQEVISATTSPNNPNGCDPNGVAPNGRSCCAVGTDFSPESCCSNNLMDYSDGRALTPCQIAKSYKHMLLNRIAYLSDIYCTSTEAINVNEGGSLVWNGARIFKGDVHISNNTTVTIRCTVYMPQGAKFIVHPGSKLIIDGGIITNRCGLLWGGVELRGSTSTTQSQTNQGVLRMINDGTIEYASIGVQTVWQQGGIIECTKGIFRNNLVSVEMNQYTRMGPAGQLDNSSYFNRCQFVVNDVSRFGALQRHDSFIKLWSVRGVRVVGCSFAVADTITSTARGRGIHSGQASYRVIDYCPVNNPLGGPCPSPNAIRNTFDNLYQAIYSAGTGITQMPTIDHAIFTHNEIGIHLSGFAQAQVINNDFYTEPYTGNHGNTRGLLLVSCTSYEVEENNFNGSYGGSVGVEVRNSGPYSNRIYRNNFKNCRVASMAVGKNRLIDEDEQDQIGLEWKCNVYGSPDTSSVTDNIYAISLAKNATISSYQGTLGGNDAAAGNLFYPDCDPLGANFPEKELKIAANSFANSTFNYIHTSGAATTPDCRTDGIGLSFGGPTTTYGTQVCIKDISTGKGPIHAIGATKFNQGIVQVLMPVYDGYINNSVGPQLKSLILDPNATSIQIRNALLDAAPKVTDNLLIMAIRRKPEMDGWHLAQGLLANSPLKSAVISELRRSGFNQYYIDLVEANQNGGLSQRVMMAMDMIHYTMERDLAKNDLLRLYTIYNNDTPQWDSLLRMPLDYSFCVTKCEEAALLMEHGSYSSAQTVLNTHCERDTARFQLLQVALDMLVNPVDSAGLKTRQITTLQGIADDDNNPMQHTACMLLEYWGGSPCELVFEYPNDHEPRSGTMKNTTHDFDEIKALMVYPNPATDNIRISTMIPSDCKSLVLNLYDAQGRIVTSHNMLSVNGLLELNCSKWPSGNYTMELIGDTIKLGTTQVVVVHNH
jgi:hypothetical protein